MKISEFSQATERFPLSLLHWFDDTRRQDNLNPRDHRFPIGILIPNLLVSPWTYSETSSIFVYAIRSNNADLRSRKYRIRMKDVQPEMPVQHHARAQVIATFLIISTHNFLLVKNSLRVSCRKKTNMKGEYSYFVGRLNALHQIWIFNFSDVSKFFFVFLLLVVKRNVMSYLPSKKVHLRISLQKMTSGKSKSDSFGKKFQIDSRFVMILQLSLLRKRVTREQWVWSTTKNCVWGNVRT